MIGKPVRHYINYGGMESKKWQGVEISFFVKSYVYIIVMTYSYCWHMNKTKFIGKKSNLVKMKKIVRLETPQKTCFFSIKFFGELRGLFLNFIMITFCDF